MFHEEGGDRLALTPDQAGARLPRLGGVWHAKGMVDLRLNKPEVIAAGTAEIISTVERDGCFIWPPLAFQ